MSTPSVVTSYRGKPSKGCAPCRAKRTKCDQKRPSCSQCIRAGRVCSGYRDPLLLAFRDQTQKFTTPPASNRSSTSPKPVSVTSPTPSFEAELPEISWALTPPLAEPIDTAATCYFFRNYVWESQDTTRGIFDYLPGIYSNSCPVDDALTDVITALGLVGIASTKSANSDAMRVANHRYSQSLGAVNRLLRDGQDAVADSTLITVMMLCLYETNTCTGLRSMKSWTQHIQGAVELLHLRGMQQLETRTGHKLFVHLRTQVIINCFQRRVAVPENISEWSDVATLYEGPEEVVNSTLSKLVIKFCNLRATMSSIHDFSNSIAILTAAVALDAELAQWAANCPFIYEPVIMRERSESVFGDYYHVYSDIWLATTWNHYRAIRILLNEVILEQLEPSSFDDGSPADFYCTTSPEIKLQLIASKSILVQLTQEICASVPFYLEFHTKTDMPPRAAGGNLLLWPLFTAACTNVVSDVMRTWVIGRLLTIAEVMGIRQAKALALLLGERKDPPSWELNSDQEFLEDEW